MSGVQAKTCREGSFCSFLFFFFFLLSLPLFWLAQSTGAQGRRLPCMLKRRLLHYRLAMVPQGTHWGTKAVTDRAYSPKQLRVLILSIIIKHRIIHFCQLHFCSFTTPTRWLVNSEGNLCSLVRCISSPIISFSGSITYYRVWLKEKYWCCAYTFCYLDSDICGMKQVCCWLSACTRWMPEGKPGLRINFTTGYLCSPANSI